jgi:hypothetical protein
MIVAVCRALAVVSLFEDAVFAEKLELQAVDANVKRRNET